MLLLLLPPPGFDLRTEVLISTIEDQMNDSLNAKYRRLCIPNLAGVLDSLEATVPLCSHHCYL
jgi:hypothetical protein